METKKISFGFMKTKKQDKPVVAEQKEYIECVEEKSIKIVGYVTFFVLTIICKTPKDRCARNLYKN